MLNLSIILEDSARCYPAKTAFVFKEANYSYTEINNETCKVANALRAIGIKAGDKVALSCVNHPAFPILYFGIIKTGAVVVPISYLLKQDEIEYHLRDCEAKAFFCYEGTEKMPMAKMGYEAFTAVSYCEHFVVITQDSSSPSPISGITSLYSFTQNQPDTYDTYKSNAEDTCVIIYTAGTTGKPKGAELTHFGLLINALFFKDLINCNSEDVMLSAIPLFHIFGMSALLNIGIYSGITNVLLPQFDAEAAFELMEKHSVTVFAGVPTIYLKLLQYTDPKFDYNRIALNLKLCLSGGASLLLQVIDDFEKRFKVPITEGYGMSENSGAILWNQPTIGRKIGSVGIANWGVEVKLIDSEGIEVPIGEKGELIYRSPSVMKGYFNKQEQTLKAIKNGWLYSGDIAIKDEDGYYFIVDRTNDMINRAGEKVYPREVEEVIIKHEQVSLVAVIGIPHKEFGQEIKAFVVLKQGQSISEKDLIAWTKEKIASYKCPSQIEFITTMPVRATGKILKKELRSNLSY